MNKKYRLEFFNKIDKFDCNVYVADTREELEPPDSIKKFLKEIQYPYIICSNDNYERYEKDGVESLLSYFISSKIDKKKICSPRCFFNKISKPDQRKKLYGHLKKLLKVIKNCNE